MLCLVIRQARQVQLPAHRSWPRHAELLVQEGRTRRGAGTAALGAEAGTTLGEDRGVEKLKRVHLWNKFTPFELNINMSEYLKELLCTWYSVIYGFHQHLSAKELQHQSQRGTVVSTGASQ